MQSDSAAWRIGHLTVTEHACETLHFRGGDWLRITAAESVGWVQLVPAPDTPADFTPLSPRTPQDGRTAVDDAATPRSELAALLSSGTPVTGGLARSARGRFTDAAALQAVARPLLVRKDGAASLDEVRDFQAPCIAAFALLQMHCCRCHCNWMIVLPRPAAAPMYKRRAARGPDVPNRTMARP